MCRHQSLDPVGVAHFFGARKAAPHNGHFVLDLGRDQNLFKE